MLPETPFRILLTQLAINLTLCSSNLSSDRSGIKETTLGHVDQEHLVLFPCGGSQEQAVKGAESTTCSKSNGHAY